MGPLLPLNHQARAQVEEATARRATFKVPRRLGLASPTSSVARPAGQAAPAAGEALDRSRLTAGPGRWGTGSAPPACKRRPGLDFPPWWSQRARVRAPSSPAAGDLPGCALELGSLSSGRLCILDSPLLYAAASFPSPAFPVRSGPRRGRARRREGDRQ